MMDTDLDHVVLEEEALAPPCNSPEHDAPAVWWVKTKEHCPVSQGDTILFCDFHMESIKDPGTWGECGGCGGFMVPFKDYVVDFGRI